ncbi:MAG: hypothetical protein ACTHJR_01535 [Sphingomonas sp.]|uniref:hypothetical protein n=1 Tax=Sphingomonas sp. TaxID=28214 RepID=UPI003F822398
MSDRNRWILHIKNLRAEHRIGLPEAERLALADPSWRRWVEHQINADGQCRRTALRHIRERGAEALIALDRDRLYVCDGRA